MVSRSCSHGHTRDPKGWPAVDAGNIADLTRGTGGVHVTFDRRVSGCRYVCVLIDSSCSSIDASLDVVRTRDPAKRELYV